MSEQVGEAHIDVVADTSAVVPQTKAAAARASKEKITLRTDVKRSDIKSFGELNFSLAKVALSAAAAGGSFTSYSTIVKGAAAATVSFGSALGETAIAASSAVGVLGALGGAVVTAKIGLIGVSDAVKAVSKAQTELATTGKVSEATLQAQRAALQNLAPEARSFVRTLGGMRDEFDQFRKGVQGALFADLDSSLRDLGGLLPQVSDEFQSIASTLNDAAKATADWLTSSEGSQRVQTILSGINDVLTALLPGLGAIARGLLVLFEGILPSSERLATSITDIGDAFATWSEGIVASGELDRIMQHAQQTAGLLVSILGNVGSALLTTFASGADEGQSMLATIDQATQSFADFLKSAQGQAGLDDFFSTISLAASELRNVFEVLGPVISSVFRGLDTLAPAIHDLQAAVQPVAQVIGQELGPAIETLAAALTPLIEGFAQLVSAFPPEFVGSLAAAAIAMKAFSLAMTPSAVGNITKAGGAVKTFASDVTVANQLAREGGGGIVGYSKNMGSLATQVKGVGAAMKGVAGAAGFAGLTLAANESNDSMKALELAASGAAIGFSVGGVWGAAIGGAVGLLAGLATATSDAEDRLKSLDEVLASAKGPEQQAATLKLATDQAAAYGPALDKAGISQQQFIDAVLHGGPALDAIKNSTLEASQAQGSMATDLTAVTTATGEVVTTTEEWRKKIVASNQAARQAAAAYRASADGIEAVSDASIAALGGMTSFQRALIDARKAAAATEGQVKRGSLAWLDLKDQAIGVGVAFDRLSPKQQAAGHNAEAAANSVETLGDKMGLTDKQTENLIRQLGLVPKDVQIKFREDGSVKVIDQAKEIKRVGDLAEHVFTTTFRFQTVGNPNPGGAVRAGGGSTPASALGGVFMTPSVTVVGDRPEIVVPLNPQAQLRPGVEKALLALAAQRGGPGAAPTININSPTGDPTAIAFTVLDRLAVAGVL